jgi:FkbM family methyltransferase
MNISIINNLLKNVLPHYIYLYLINTFKFNKKYHSINSIDKKLKKYLNYKNGFYVELGANDGITQSNTLFFEKKRNWKGILIEPNPYLFHSCCLYRKKNNKIYCNACTSFDYKDKFVEIIYSNLMSTSLNLESDILDKNNYIDIGKNHLDKNILPYNFGSLAMPLNNILITSNSPNIIDLLSLDVEGSEIEVLKGINHSQFRFKFICVECRDILKLENYLVNNGYKLIEKLSDHDYLFSSLTN